MKLKKILAVGLACYLAVSTPATSFLYATEPVDSANAKNKAMVKVEDNSKEAKNEIDKLFSNQASKGSSSEEDMKQFKEDVQKVVDKYAIGTTDFGNATKWITAYYYKDNVPCKSWDELVERASSANGSTGATTPQQTPSSSTTPTDNATTIATEGTAENGVLKKKTNHFTEKEVEYRSNEKNLELIKKYLEDTKSKYTSSLTDYETKFKPEDIVVKDDSDSDIKGAHVPIKVYKDDKVQFSKTSAESTGTISKYDLISSILTSELEGLEVFTIYQTLIDFGKTDEEKKNYTSEYKEFADLVASKLYPNEGDTHTIKKGSDGRSYVDSYYYYDSVSLVKAERGLAYNKEFRSIYSEAIGELINNALTNTSGESTVFNFTEIGNDGANLLSSETDNKKKKEMQKWTAEFNNKGIPDIKVALGTTSYSKLDSLRFLHMDNAQSLLAMLTSYEQGSSLKDSILKDKEERPNALMITDRFSCSKINNGSASVELYDNKFLPIELAVYGALDWQSIYKECGIDPANPPTDLSSNEEFKAFVTFNRDGIVKAGLVGKALANFYEVMGYPGRAKTLRDNVNSMLQKISDTIFKELGLSLIETKEIEIGDNITPTVKVASTTESGDKDASEQDEFDNLKDREEYYELLAWTGAFTPFEVNVNNLTDNMTYLSEAARKLYCGEARLGLKRNPVYAVKGNTRNITAVKMGNTRAVETITLRNFINRVKTEDMVLFAGALTEDQINAYASDSIVLRQSKTDDKGNSETELTSLPVLADSTGNTVKYFGPIYMSSCDPNLAIKKGLDKYKKEEKSADNMADLILDSNLKNQNKDGNNQNQDSVDLDNKEKALTDIPLYTNSAQAAELSKHITASHLYLNYALMWNVLQDGHQLDGAIEPDLDRPLYTDFLGNIITESGYVVVPAAANTTYYKDIRTAYPFYTAMLLNSYPTVGVNVSSNLSLQDWDGDKYVIATEKDKTRIVEQKQGPYESNSEEGLTEGDSKGYSARSWKFKLMRFSKDGLDEKGQMYITMPNTKFYISMLSEGSGILRKPPVDSNDNALQTSIDFIDPISSFQAVGEILNTLGSTKSEDAKVYALPQEYINVCNTEGKLERVPIAHVSPIGTSVSWQAVKQLLMNHYLNSVGLQGDLNNRLHLDKGLLRIAKITAQCSESPQQMLLDDNFIDFNESLREDTFLRGFGTFLEAIYNKAYAFIRSNLMLYTPTLNKLLPSDKLALWVKPLTIMLILIVFTVILFIVVFNSFTDNRDTITESIVHIVVLSLLLSYSVYVHPAVSEKLFTDLPQLVLGNANYDYYLYNQEAKNKIQRQYFYDNNSEAKPDHPVEIKLQKLNRDEVLELRQYEKQRPETDSPYYSASFDSSRLNVIGEEIYLKGDSLYTTVDTLLEGSSLEDYKYRSGSYAIGQELYDTADKLTTYLPYYHILETLTNTVNTYTEDCDVEVRVKNYANKSMLTGRATAFFSSIFFIAPDHLDDLRARLVQIYTANSEEEKQKLEIDTSLSEGDRKIKSEQIDTNLQEKTEAIDKGFQYILDSIGGKDDWLGIHDILYPEDSSIFSEDAAKKIKLTDWYPNLSGMSDALIEKYIATINHDVKQYVLDDILPISTSLSDSAALKIIALKATIEFDKVFSKPLSKQLYPKKLEIEGLDNKFNLTATYIPRQTLYRSSSIGLSYVLSSKEGWVALLSAGFEAFFRFILYILIILAVGYLTIVPFLLFVTLILRRQVLFNTLYLTTALAFTISMCRYILVILYRADIALIASYGPISVSAVNIIVYIITIFLVKRGVYWVEQVIDSLMQNFISQSLISSGAGTDMINRRDYTANSNSNEHQYSRDNTSTFEGIYARSNPNLDRTEITGSLANSRMYTSSRGQDLNSNLDSNSRSNRRHRFEQTTGRR